MKRIIIIVVAALTVCAVAIFSMKETTTADAAIPTPFQSMSESVSDTERSELMESVPESVVSNADVGNRTIEDRCVNRNIVDPICGDSGLGAASNSELESAAASGNAIASHYLGMRHHRSEPYVALEYYHLALLQGSITSLGSMAALLGNIASEVEEESLRVALVNEAYAHLIAGFMLGYGEYASDLMSLHTSRFSEIPVPVESCRMAVELIALVNAQRDANRAAPLEVQYGHAQAIGALSANYGYCL